MKRLLSMFLCLAMLFTFAACGSKDDSQALKDWKPEDPGSYPTINQKFTRESLKALPIKSADMTEDQLRQLVVDFMLFSKLQALYTPSVAYKYEITPIYPDEYVLGNVYSGMAFMNTGCGNIYRLLDIMDEETGVLNMTDLMANIDLFSNTGPSACYWAWGRVSSSINYSRLVNMTHANGFVRVGEYTYNDAITEFGDKVSTTSICQQNGLVTMSNSYAALKPADALITSTAENSQMMMVMDKVNIAYFDGSDVIDPTKSTVTYVDQNYIWGEQKNDAGDTFLCKNNVGLTVTFSKLYEKGYIPFTVAELNGTKPVEETKVETTLSGDSVDTDTLFSGKVTSNYGISDIYITLKNKDGDDVYRHIVRATLAGVKELTVNEDGENVFTQGDLSQLKGQYTVEVSVQLSTGERPIVYSGNVKLG